jgi:hypothetical protein
VSESIVLRGGDEIHPLAGAALKRRTFESAGKKALEDGLSRYDFGSRL